MTKDWQTRRWMRKEGYLVEPPPLKAGEPAPEDKPKIPSRRQVMVTGIRRDEFEAIRRIRRFNDVVKEDEEL